MYNKLLQSVSKQKICMGAKILRIYKIITFLRYHRGLK